MIDEQGPRKWFALDLWLALWGALALLLIGLMWAYALRIDSQDRQRIRKEVIASVAAAADAYEQYITRSTAQIDHISMQLSQSWEQAGGQLDLRRLARSGMFLDGAFSCVALVDAHGAITSAVRADACPATLAQSALLQHHRNNNTSALAIGPAPDARGSAHAVVLFSRRLDAADGAFAGIILVSVRSEYFTQFYLPGDRQGSMVAMAGTESSLRAERGAGAAMASSFPANVSLWDSVAGATLVDGAVGFPDQAAWALGWRRSSGYPLVGLVAMARTPSLQMHSARWRQRQQACIGASAAVLVLAAVCLLYSRRAAQRHAAREHIRTAYRAATEGANDGFYMAAPVRDAHGDIIDFDIVDCNERGARFYGISRPAMIGKRLSSIDTRVFGDRLFDVYLKAMETGLVEDERQMPADNRLSIAWGRRRIVRVGDGLAITLQDVSERKAHVAELKRLSNEDLLTGLPNRQWLLAYLPTVLADARLDVALLFIDLDDFKQINETLGHPAGDELLKAATKRLRALLRPDDVLVRFGGDEFVALLIPAESDQHAGTVATRIVDAFTSPFVLDAGRTQVGASVGISVVRRDGIGADDLIKNGAVAMESAKVDGKGCYRHYCDSLSRSVHGRARMKQDLLEAIEDDQFVLYYQPRVDVHTGELCSMEALLRWVHPVQAMISPAEFIPLAESSGLILPIGAMVMDKACAQIAAWRRAGLPLVPVSINVSPKQFAHGQVHVQLAACLARHAIAPALLEMEITESAMMGNQDHIVAQLAAIRQLGVKLHVDDFGTGYSSLSQLQKLKMDVLKVDRAFTSELAISREGKVFFQAIVSMAHALGMTVVAEGVENAAQLAVLQQLGCNEVQGYFVARPMPARDMGAMMTRRFLFALRGALAEAVS
ncbi:MAG: EAL domain-containing protein [Pseudomonadota bacterium]